MTAEGTQRKELVGVAVALVAVAGLALVLGWREIFGPDIGFHLECGRRILERGWQLPDDLTWTATDRRYIDLQWSWQIALVGMYRALGTAGIVGSNLALALGAMAVMAVRSFRREGSLSVWVPLWLLAFAGANLWEVRPHTASWLLLGAVLLVLEERRRGAPRAVWLLPPLMVLWVNVHSLFVLGLAAIGIHGVVALLRERAAARPLLLAGALAFVACFLNPFTYHGVLYPARQLFEISGASVFNGPDVGVTEFQSPWSLFEYTAQGSLVLLQPILFVHLAAALALLAVALGWRRLDLADALVLGAFGFLLWQAEKNAGYFLAAAAPAVVAGLCARPMDRRLRGALAAALVAVCAILSLQVRSGWMYAHQRLPHRFGHAFSETFLPVRACAFLNARVPEGRLLNHWDEGGFVSFATRRKTFIDARTDVMGERFFRAYLRLSDPATMEAELARWDPQIALVPVQLAPEWLPFFLSSRRWRLVYADESDFVFLREGFAPGIPALPRPAVPLPAPGRIDRAVTRAMALRPATFLETLRKPHHDPLIEQRAAASWLYRREPVAALASAVLGFERATLPSPGLLYNLTLALLGAGDAARARRCYEALPPQRQDPGLREEIERAGAGEPSRLPR